MNYEEMMLKIYHSLGFAENDLSAVAFHEKCPPLLAVLCRDLLDDVRSVICQVNEVRAALEDQCE